MSATGYFGQLGLSDSSDELARIRFIVRQELASTRTGVPVKIVAVHGGGSGPAPTVDVLPLINQVDGAGNRTPHETVYGVPVARTQGGTNVVICDPMVGDVGHMICSDRDTSSLRATAKQANPGSYRRHSLADGVYHGAMVNPANPTQAVQFTEEGLVLFDGNGNRIEMTSGAVKITTTELHVTGDVTAGDGAVSLLTHIHTDVATGADLSGPPEGGGA